MISVLINNHNYGQFIGQAIESVIAQDYSDFEIIIVDGDSTDNSRDVIMSYVNRYPHIITAIFKPTSGQAAAFNVGYKMCKGDIVAFLDADDYYLENKLSKIALWHQQYDFVGHGRIFHGKNAILGKTTVISDDYDTRPQLLKKYGYVYTYNLITSCISMTKKLADKIFPMPEERYITFADCYVKVSAQYYSNIKYFEEQLTYYRIHDKQKTRSFEDEKKIEAFCENLYANVFCDINCKLREKNEEMIPNLFEGNNLKDALMLANSNINMGGKRKFAIYGTGVYSYKVYKYIKAMGGEFLFAIDSDDKKWGRKWNDVEILSFDIALKRMEEVDQIIIGTNNYVLEIENIIIGAGLKKNIDFTSFVSMPND